MTDLSLHQEKTLKAFDAEDIDLDIVVLYTRVYGDPGSLSVRKMQQKLAPTFAAINEKLKRQRIEPGEIKRTYRLAKKRG